MELPLMVPQYESPAPGTPQMGAAAKLSCLLPPYSTAGRAVGELSEKSELEEEINFMRYYSPLGEHPGEHVPYPGHTRKHSVVYTALEVGDLWLVSVSAAKVFSDLEIAVTFNLLVCIMGK